MDNLSHDRCNSKNFLKNTTFNFQTLIVYLAILFTCYRDVLSPACERRGVDLSRVEVLDSSSTPLSLLTTDASTLGGKHLRVTCKFVLYIYSVTFKFK